MLYEVITDYVLVSGASIVKNWTKSAGMTEGVMEADISGLTIETPFTQLFANGETQMMARHPNNVSGKMMDPMDINNGYALLSNVRKDAGASATGYITLEGTTVPDVDLTGGIARGLTGKMAEYVFGTITANSGNSVSFTPLNNGDWKSDAAITSTKHKFSWGFVMHKNLIDYPGEWFADNPTPTWPAGSGHSLAPPTPSPQPASPPPAYAPGEHLPGRRACGGAWSGQFVGCGKAVVARAAAR